jgi:hypothetical protein
MGSFKFINHIVVLTVIIKLLFKLFKKLLEFLFCIKNFKFHLGYFRLVVLFYLGFTDLYFRFVFFKLLLSFLSFGGMPIFNLFNHGFDPSLISGLLEGFLLTNDNRVGLLENDFNFLLVCAREWVLILDVLLVLWMEMKDDLSELSNFLTHLMMDIFRGLGSSCCHCCYFLI